MQYTNSWKFTGFFIFYNLWNNPKKSNQLNCFDQKASIFCIFRLLWAYFPSPEMGPQSSGMLLVIFWLIFFWPFRHLSAVDPGAVKTNIMREIPSCISQMAFIALKLLGLLQSSEAGVCSIVDAALASPVSTETLKILSLEHCIDFLRLCCDNIFSFCATKCCFTCSYKMQFYQHVKCTSMFLRCLHSVKKNTIKVDESYIQLKMFPQLSNILPLINI